MHARPFWQVSRQAADLRASLTKLSQSRSGLSKAQKVNILLDSAAIGRCEAIGLLHDAHFLIARYIIDPAADYFSKV